MLYKTTRTFSLNGLCHEMNIFWNVNIINRHFLHMCWLFLSWWKNQTQTLNLLLWNYLLILKIFPVTCFNDPKRRYWHWQCIQEAAAVCDPIDKSILAHFPWSHWEVDTREHRPITENWILRMVSVSMFKISKTFKRSK